MDQPTPNAPNSNQATFPAARPPVGHDVHPGGTMDMDFPLIFTSAVFSVLLVATIILLTQAWFHHEVNIERQDARKRTVNYELQAIHEQQLAHISEYRWVDSKHQVVTLPIERAMELTIERNRKVTDAKNSTKSTTPTKSH